jgi:hypothetical protein
MARALPGRRTRHAAGSGNVQPRGVRALRAARRAKSGGVGQGDRCTYYPATPRPRRCRGPGRAAGVGAYSLRSGPVVRPIRAGVFRVFGGSLSLSVWATVPFSSAPDHLTVGWPLFTPIYNVGRISRFRDEDRIAESGHIKHAIRPR